MHVSRELVIAVSDDFELRLRRAEEILARVAEGDLEQKLPLSATDDVLTGLEMGINFLIVDLRQTAQKNREQRQELEQKLLTIAQQAEAIRGLTTPVIEIWDDVLVLPIVGVVDSRRSLEIMTDLLEAIAETRARCVIVDVTGVDVIDTATADTLLKIVRAASLLGTRCVLTGISPSVAQTLATLGADLSGVRTLRNLKAGLLDCLRFLKKKTGE